MEFGVELGDAYTNKHKKKYNDVAKTIRLAYANVIAGVLEGNQAACSFWHAPHHLTSAYPATVEICHSRSLARTTSSRLCGLALK